MNRTSELRETYISANRWKPCTGRKPAKGKLIFVKSKDAEENYITRHVCIFDGERYLTYHYRKCTFVPIEYLLLDSKVYKQIEKGENDIRANLTGYVWTYVGNDMMYTSEFVAAKDYMKKLKRKCINGGSV